MKRVRRVRLEATAAALGLALFACAGESGSGGVSTDDDVIDESAGDEAIAVLTGKASGVAVIAAYTDGSDVDAVTEALRDDYQLIVTSRYHDLVRGAAFIAPDEGTVALIAADPRVLELSRDRLLSFDDGGAMADLAADLEAAGDAGEIDPDMETMIEAGSAVTGGGSGDHSIKELTPQKPSTGWRLIGGPDAPGDGRGMVVAVLDSGVDYNHPDLARNIHGSMRKDCLRRTNKTSMDFNGHGTHVAGIIAAIDNGFGTVGIAPRATIVPVRVLDRHNNGTASSMLCGLDYVARRSSKIDAVNMSIQSECGEPCVRTWPRAQVEAVRTIIRRGVFLAGCAGNFGTDVESSFPGFIDEVVTVSNYADLDGKISRTDHFNPSSNFGRGVDIGGPGTLIMSTWINEKDKSVFRFDTGCSMATPFVTGAAVVYKQVFGGKPSAIRERLIGDARTSYPGRGKRHAERLLHLAAATGGGSGEGCGNGVCSADETDATCADDCGCAAALDCNGVSPFGCYCDPNCAAQGDCCADAAAACPAE